MNIALKTLPALYINLDEQISRSKKTKKVLSKYFNDVTRISGYRGYKEPAPGQDFLWIAQARSFEKAVNHQDPPFILFEDDIQDRYFIENLEVPDDADVVFLGGSAWGGQQQASTFSLTEYENVLRVHNMYTMHAVLFLSSSLIEEYSQRLLSNEGICDVVFNNMIKEGNYNFYAINPVLFYQHDPENMLNSSATRIKNYLTLETFDV